jgi:hypothetical protein
MSDQIVITVPDDIYARARQIAETTGQAVEKVLLDHLQTLPSPVLPSDIQVELDALPHLSDDVLWTIAREQMPADIQARAQQLMDKNSRGVANDEELANSISLSSVGIG